MEDNRDKQVIPAESGEPAEELGIREGVSESPPQSGETAEPELGELPEQEPEKADEDITQILESSQIHESTITEDD